MSSNDSQAPVWFITGTSTGFGRSFAEYAIARGYRVVATARKPEVLEDIVHMSPDRVLATKLDVNDSQTIQSAIQAALDRFGRIDVLINNAGYAVFGAVEETTDELLRDQFNTNFFGAMNVTRAVLPIMRAQKSGFIVQNSSGGGSVSWPCFGAYCATKFALEGISEALAAEVASFGIKVLIVKPGAFRTDAASGKSPIAPSIPAYDGTPARVFTQTVLDSHGRQRGDPYRAAEAIDRVLQSPDPPLRLLLGADAADMVYDNAVKQQEEYDSWDALARSTDFPN